MIGDIIASVNDALYSYILIIVLILGGLSLLKEKFVVQSKLSGKIATIVLFICVILILVFL